MMRRERLSYLREKFATMPVVTLPDGSQRPFDHPVTVDEVAASIGPALRKAALAGRDNGRLNHSPGAMRSVCIFGSLLQSVRSQSRRR